MERQSLEDVIKQNFGQEIGAINKVVKINQTDHAQGHICPNVEKWLQKGVSGLLEDAQNHYENADEDKKNFIRQ